MRLIPLGVRFHNVYKIDILFACKIVQSYNIFFLNFLYFTPSPGPSGRNELISDVAFSWKANRPFVSPTAQFHNFTLGAPL